MTQDEFEVREREAEAQLRQHVSQFMDVYAPQVCRIHGKDEEGVCECGLEMRDPATNFVLQEYVLATAWVDFDDGSAAYDYVTNENMLASHTLGLLALVKMSVKDTL